MDEDILAAQQNAGDVPGCTGNCSLHDPHTPPQALSVHPLFAFTLHRAARKKERHGEISHEQADKIYDAILRPWRKDDKGNTCNLMEELQKHTTKLAQADPNEFMTFTGMNPSSLSLPNFDWGAIGTWITSHLPQILEALAAIVTIFMLFV